MRIADIKENDIVNGEGVCVSLWVQGCPHKCKGCHNPETWDFSKGKEDCSEVWLKDIIAAIEKNGIQRNFSVLGGEPLCKENIFDVAYIITSVRKRFPNIKIFLWTGYTIEELKERDTEPIFHAITLLTLSKIDYLIEGRYIEEERDITLKWRGSRNQRIFTKEEIIEMM